MKLTHSEWSFSIFPPVHCLGTGLATFKTIIMHLNQHQMSYKKLHNFKFIGMTEITSILSGKTLTHITAGVLTLTAVFLLQSHCFHTDRTRSKDCNIKFSPPNQVNYLPKHASSKEGYQMQNPTKNISYSP